MKCPQCGRVLSKRGMQHHGTMHERQAIREASESYKKDKQWNDRMRFNRTLPKGDKGGRTYRYESAPHNFKREY